MRNLISSTLEVVGMSSVTAGAWVAFGSGWGLIVGGTLCVLTGVRSAQ